MYLFDSRIRYSETDSEGRLTLNSLIDYFQDASTFHSEDLGLGLEYLNKNHMVWVLSSWQIEVLRYPVLGERVEIGTFPYEFKSFLGSRNFLMQTKEGELLARANSLWSLIDTESFRPVQPPEEMLTGYVLEEKLPMDYAGRKILFPKEFREEEPIEIKKNHLDTNHHVNNGQYVNMAIEYLPESFKIGSMRAEYKKQAFLNDVLYPAVASEEGKLVVRFADAEGKPYVLVEFTV